jgi:hypothetical protein
MLNQTRSDVTVGNPALKGSEYTFWRNAVFGKEIDHLLRSAVQIIVKENKVP